MGTELDAMASQYGGTTSAGIPAYVDPTDLLVYTGRQLEGSPRGPKPRTPLKPPRVVERTKPMSQMQKEFFAKSPDELRELQRRLYAAGFYGSYDPDKIVLGVHDEVTFEAYKTAVERAGRFYAAGQKKTVDDVIDESAGILDQQYGKGTRRGDSSGGAGTRSPLTIGLANPEDLRAVAQRTATGTIGRALTDEELSRFVASFHQAQASAQTSAYNADVTGGSVTDAPSAGTAAENFARAQAPTEAGGQDFFRTFSAFRRIIGGGA